MNAPLDRHRPPPFPNLATPARTAAPRARRRAPPSRRQSAAAVRAARPSIDPPGRTTPASDRRATKNRPGRTRRVCVRGSASGDTPGGGARASRGAGASDAGHAARVRSSSSPTPPFAPWAPCGATSWGRPGPNAARIIRPPGAAVDPPSGRFRSVPLVTREGRARVHRTERLPLRRVTMSHSYPGGLPTAPPVILSVAKDLVSRAPPVSPDEHDAISAQVPPCWRRDPEMLHSDSRSFAALRMTRGNRSASVKPRRTSARCP